MQLILWCFQFFQGAYTGKDHSQAHAHVHADEVPGHAGRVHDHAGEEKILLKPMLMFMLMQAKITWWACWALVGPAFPLLGPFPVINVRYKLRQQPILPTVKFSIWAAAHKPNALRHRGREAASARDIFLFKDISFFNDTFVLQRYSGFQKYFFL